jgi:hypothetical protein
MTSETVQAIILLIILGLMLIAAMLPFIPPDEIITNGTVTGLQNKGEYYVYELKANDKIISGVISTNYYDLDSKHKIWFVQNMIGVTAGGQFI